MNFGLNRSTGGDSGTLSSAGLSSAVAVSRGASYLTIQTLITTVAQVLSFAILARIITPSEVGILAILQLILGFCQAINGSAFQQAATKFIGELSAGRGEAGSAVFYLSLRVTLILSVPLSAVVFLGAPVLASALLGSVAGANLFRVLAADLLISSGVLLVATGTILGMKKFRAAATIGSVVVILRQCLIILLILWLKNFVGLVFAWIVSDAVLLAAYTVYIIHVLGLPKVHFSLRKLVSFSWPLSITSLVNFAYSWFDRALLIVFVPLASLGVYNATLTAFAALSGISGSVNNALLPVYSDIQGRRGLESCRRATWLTSRYASLTMVPLAFGLLATAKLAITTFVGQAYVGGTDALIVLSLFFALTVFGSTLGPMLPALSETRAVLWITVASVLLGLVSVFGFVPFLGITGASIARGLAMAGSLGLTIVVLRRKKAIHIDVKTMWKSLVAGAVMAGVLVAVQLVAYSRLLLPVYVILGGVVYLVALRFLRAVRKHDIELIHRYMGSRLNLVSRILGFILVAK